MATLDPGPMPLTTGDEPDMRLTMGTMRTALLAMMLLSACATRSAHVRNVKGPDGEPMMWIDCGHMVRCMDAAAAECPNGYVVVRQGESIDGMSSNQQNWTAYNSTSQTSVDTSAHMLIHCKWREEPLKGE